MNQKITLFILFGIISLSFGLGESFAFDPQEFNMKVNDSQTYHFDGYDIISIDLNLMNNGVDDIAISGFNTIFLNDTNGDYWEPINHNDFGFSETECPVLDELILANSTTNFRLCFLTTDELTIGYSLIIEDNDYFTQNEAKEFVLESVPTWYKTITSSWCSNTISESEFLLSAQSYIQDGTIKVMRGQNVIDTGVQTPEWVKGNACLWATDQISDYEFLDSLYWYIDNGRIQLN